MYTWFKSTCIYIQQLLKTTHILHIYAAMVTNYLLCSLYEGTCTPKRLVQGSLEVGHLKGPGIEKLLIGDNGELDMHDHHCSLESDQRRILVFGEATVCFKTKSEPMARGREGGRGEEDIHTRAGQLVKHTGVYSSWAGKSPGVGATNIMA